MSILQQQRQRRHDDDPAAQPEQRPEHAGPDRDREHEHREQEGGHSGGAIREPAGVTRRKPLEALVM